MLRLSRRNVLGAAALAAVARPALVWADEPLNVSVVPANAIHWVQFVAADKGFYKQAGFEPRILALQGSTQSLQAALADEYQIATSQPETFVSAVMQGATELAAMAAPANSCDWILVGSRDTHSLEDLKGKSIGLSGLRSSEEWLTGRLLEQHGMKRTDCKYVIAGTSAAKASALETGGIAAAVLFQPSAEFAVSNGLPALARFDVIRSYPTILYVVKKSWASTGNAGKRASEAIGHAHDWLWDPGNKEEALRILAKYTKRELDILRPVYEAYFAGSTPYSRTGQIDVAGFGTVLADMAEDGRVFTKAPEASQFLLDPALGGLSG